MISEEAWEAIGDYGLIDEVSKEVFAMWFANVKSLRARYKVTTVFDAPVDDDVFDYEDTLHDAGSGPGGVGYQINATDRPYPRNFADPGIISIFTPLYLTEALALFPHFSVIPTQFIRAKKFYTFLSTREGSPDHEVDRRATTDELYLKTFIDFGSFAVTTEQTVTVTSTFY